MKNVFKRILKLMVMDVKTKFCDWLCTEKKRDSTVISHNVAGYYNNFKVLRANRFIIILSALTISSFLE